MKLCEEEDCVQIATHQEALGRYSCREHCQCLQIESWGIGKKDEEGASNSIAERKRKENP